MIKLASGTHEPGSNKWCMNRCGYRDRETKAHVNKGSKQKTTWLTKGVNKHPKPGRKENTNPKPLHNGFLLRIILGTNCRLFDAVGASRTPAELQVSGSLFS